jgi:hypothetical protein
LKFIKSFPVYFLLFSIYPILALLGFNISEVEPDVLFRPLFVSVVITLTIFLVLRLLLGNSYKAALGVSILLLLFFSYGHIYNYLKAINFGGFIPGRHRLMVPVWVGLGIFFLWWLGKKVRDAKNFVPTLNLVAAFLLIYPTVQISSYIWSETSVRSQAQQAIVETKSGLPAGYAPDVYYIILDAYGRDDVLRDVYEYDNTPFLSKLEAMGFYVAQCSQSNYAQSMLSITSSLNMNYLDKLTNVLSPDTTNRAPLRALGKYNEVRNFFDSIGYNTVSFATSFPASEWEDADYFLTPNFGGMNDFELMIMQTSAGRVFMDSFFEPPEKSSAEWYRLRTLFVLEKLQNEIRYIPGPKFVFAHLVIPHHPFVFGPNGEEINYIVQSKPDFPDYVFGYRNQVIFINKRIEDIIETIIAESDNPPIIVIQADHGPATFDVIENRMRILNAYYLPGQSQGLYKTISPVNTFRLILNNYFDQKYEMLEDVSYFSEYDGPYEYINVPNRCDR